MKCPNCSYRNREGASFCHHCGAALTTPTSPPGSTGTTTRSRSTKPLDQASSRPPAPRVKESQEQQHATPDEKLGHEPEPGLFCRTTVWSVIHWRGLDYTPRAWLGQGVLLTCIRKPILRISIVFYTPSLHLPGRMYISAAGHAWSAGDQLTESNGRAFPGVVRIGGGPFPFPHRITKLRIPALVLWYRFDGVGVSFPDGRALTS